MPSNSSLILLSQTKRTDQRLLVRMKNHYSKPKGFVGRSICYSIHFNNIYYGHIIGGSATRFLPGRNEFLGITIKDLNFIVNNIFYNVSKVNNKYPMRNFTSAILIKFMEVISVDWKKKYGDRVIGFESLIEKPRTGELYKRAGWVEVGITKGYTCKRTKGKGSDTWSGKRVWCTDKNLLRPKLIFCYKNKERYEKYNTMDNF